MNDKEIKDLDEKKINELKEKSIENIAEKYWKFSDIWPHMDIKEPSYAEMVEFGDLKRLRDIYRLIDGLKGEIAYLEQKLPTYTSYGRPLPFVVGKAICIKCGKPATKFYIENVRPPNYIFYCDEHATELEKTVEDPNMISTKRCYKTDGVSNHFKPTKADMLKKIKKIYLNIIEHFNTICSTGDPKDFLVLSNDFKNLRNMPEHIVGLGSKTIYDKYTLMIGCMGACQASLIKLNPKQVGVGETWMLNKDALSSLATSFCSLYSSIEKLIVSLA